MNDRRIVPEEVQDKLQQRGKLRIVINPDEKCNFVA
jgi:hypothetical protein